MEKITPILEKYNHFKAAQIRSIATVAEGSKVVTIVIQDDDGEDVSSVVLRFDEVVESRILDNSVLAFMDMMSGITLVKEHELYGFALGQGSAMLHVHNAPLFIVAKHVEINEN